MAGQEGLHIFFDSLKESSGETDTLRTVLRFATIACNEMIKERVKAVAEGKNPDDVNIEKFLESYKDEITSFGLTLPAKLSHLLTKGPLIPTDSIEFEFPKKTLDEWKDELISKKIRPVDGIHYKVIGNLAYFNDKDDTYKEDPEVIKKTVWSPCARLTDNDNRAEDNLLRYADKDRLKPDWNASLKNLKEFGEKNGYMDEHYKMTLQRWISWFEPSLLVLIQTKSSNEIAKFLLELFKPIDPTATLQRDLMNMARQPGEDLRAKLALLRALAQALYEKCPEKEKMANVERIMLNGLIQFTAGTVRKNLETAIEYQRRQGEPLHFEGLLKGVEKSERIYGPPVEPLPYNAPLQSTMTLFNVRTAPAMVAPTCKSDESEEQGLRRLQELTIGDDHISGARGVSQGATAEPETARCISQTEKKQPDHLQVGLNQSNIRIAPTPSDLIVQHILQNYNLQPRYNLRSNSRDDQNRSSYQSQNRSRSRERSSSYNRNADRSQNRDHVRDSPQRNYRSQDRNPSPRRSSPARSPNRTYNGPNRSRRSYDYRDIRRGENCSQDYHPDYEFRCLKCLTENDHHEFMCKKYFTRARYNCPSCGRGFHYKDECDEGSWPPSRGNSPNRKQKN